VGACHYAWLPELLHLMLPPPPLTTSHQVNRVAAVLHAQNLAAAASMSATSAAGFSVGSTPLPPAESAVGTWWAGCSGRLIEAKLMFIVYTVP
jgi:hypothetical protein